MCILCLLYVVLLQHGKMDLMDHCFLQCFDTVGWVI